MIHSSEFTSKMTGFCQRPQDEWYSYALNLNYPVIEESTLQFLETWGLLTRPKRILELGCGFGLMSYRLLSVLPESTLTGIDYNGKNEEVFKKFANKSEVGKRFTFLTGNVTELLPALNQTFDWIIVDVDKKYYPELFLHLPEKLNTGGYLIADNVLWKGWVTRPGEKKNPEPIRKWNELAFSHDGFETILLPVGDGLTIMRKK